MAPARIPFGGPSTGRAVRLTAAAATLLATLACGKSPTAPTTPPTGAAPPEVHSIAGLVTDPGGAAVAGAAVEIVGGSSAGRRTTTGADGRYVLDGLAEGMSTVAVSADGFASRKLDVRISGATQVDVKLPPAGDDTPPSPGDPSPETVAVSGRIQFEAAPAAAEARIEITTGPNAGRRATAAADGTYLLDELRPGEATLVASAPGFVSRTLRTDLDEDEVIDFVLTPAGFPTTGRVVDALSSSGVGGVRIAADQIGEATSDSAGAFSLQCASPEPATTWLTLTAAGIVERRTRAQVPGDALEVSVIPATFDLHAFDEMFRSPGLQRWREAPRLLVERRAVDFAGEDMTAGTASGEPMTDDEVGSLVTDLTWALPQLSGERFPRFAAVDLRTTDAGAAAPLLNDDVITVVRVRGLTAATGFWGFSRWRYEPDGTVTGGLILLDADFDAGASPYRRALRAHELGHALGYRHVTSRPSVMNASARLEPTDFDRQASRIAFERQPGNRAPDIDPEDARINRVGAARWSRPIR